MATTDARTGFRLPWSTDQRQADERAPDAAESADTAAIAEVAEVAEAGDTTATTESVDNPAPAADEVPEAPAEQAFDEPADPVVRPDGPVEDLPHAAAPAPVPPRRQNKFMADLTRAMQAAAETAREESVGRFATDASQFVEQIQARSTEEADALRRQADADINEIRDWSKAEIARIRDQTDLRIADRKSQLEHETEQHAARIEHEIERVRGRVDDFEAEMARFFERLRAEDDPTRFAALAENLPEPPSFDVSAALAEAATLTLTEPEAPADPIDELEPDSTASPESEVVESPDPSATPWGATAVDPSEVASVDDTTEAGPSAEAVDPSDPRLAVLGLNPDSAAAAEAEAFAFDASAEEPIDIPQIGEDVIAARLAGFLPAADGEVETPVEMQVTRVIVVGLVSVASIASFKRHLGRLPGVQAVGVSSGPDGEFVFAATHGPEVVLADSVPTVPGFQARVTGSDDGVVNVTAHDPESDS
jgi:hypothetical protein